MPGDHSVHGRKARLLAIEHSLLSEPPTPSRMHAPSYTRRMYTAILGFQDGQVGKGGVW